MIFKALANQVQVKGSTIIQTPPIVWYRPKNATTEIAKRSQYIPVDFLLLSIVKICNENSANGSIIQSPVFYATFSGSLQFQQS